MKNKPLISGIFYLTVVYDGILGIAFLFFAPAVFESFGVTPPNHYGYVHFPGALLLVFALLYLAIARDPIGNRNLMPYGMLLKVSYCCVAFYHWIASGIPNMWKPFAIIDLVFLALFLWAWQATRPEPTPAL